MMKVLVGFGVVILILVLLALILPLLIDLNRYQDQYRPFIEDALNRKVSLKGIQLTILPRVGVRITELSVLDDPAFGSTPFASLTSIEVGVKLMPLLTGRVEVDEIVLQDPTITIIRNREGALNVSTIGKNSLAGPQAVTRMPTHPPSNPLRILALLAVDRVSLTGGTVTYRDLSTKRPAEYTLQDLTVRLSSVGLGKTSNLHVATLMQPMNVPLTIDGRFGPLKETADIEAATATVSLGNTQFVLTGKSVGGRTSVNVTSPVINSADLPVSLPFRNPIEIKNLQIAVELDGYQAQVSHLTFDLLNGQVKAQGEVTLGAEAPPFDVHLAVQGLQLGPVLKAVGADALSISGSATADLAVRGHGFSLPNLTKALEGTAHVAVQDGKLGGINLLHEVATLLEVAGIATDNPNVMVFTTIEGDAVIKQGVITVQRLLIESHDLQAVASGTVGFDQTFNLKATLSLSEALSQKIAAASPAAKLAMAGGRMTVPLLITGTAQRPVYRLDTETIAAKVQERIKENVKGRVQEMLKSKSVEEAVQKGQEILKKFFGQ